MRVLILGASGDQGFPQIAAATNAGHQVCAATRHPEKMRARWPSPDVQWVTVDYAHPDTLARAMQDVDAVLANYPSSSFNAAAPLLDAAQQTAVAARSAGIRLLVFNTSLPVMDAPRGYAAHDVRLQMRQALGVTGVPLICIQPVVFMDNLLRGWAFPHIADEDRFLYPHDPSLQVSWLCQDDLAALMVAAAERPHLAGQRFAVGGPQPLRGNEVAAALTVAAGRKIRFESQSVEAFCASMEVLMRSRLGPERTRMLEELGNIYRWYNSGIEKPFWVDMAPVLRHLPVTLTSFSDWARRQTWRR